MYLLVLVDTFGSASATVLLRGLGLGLGLRLGLRLGLGLGLGLGFGLGFGLGLGLGLNVHSRLGRGVEHPGHEGWG